MSEKQDQSEGVMTRIKSSLAHYVVEVQKYMSAQESLHHGASRQRQSRRQRDFTVCRDESRFLPLSVHTNPFVAAVAANCSSVLNINRFKNIHHFFCSDRSDVYILAGR